MFPPNQQQVKRKVFISYHHGCDQAYYDAFSKAFCDTYDVISDNSLEREIDSDDVEYVIQRIRNDYVTGSSCTIVLVGKDTWGRKYVDWEIKATLEKEHGLIGVVLPTVPISMVEPSSVIASNEAMPIVRTACGSGWVLSVTRGISRFIENSVSGKPY